MNFYDFHIGDYTSRTAHLEPMEDLAYRRLLDLYYVREEALPVEIDRLAKLVRLKGQEDAIEAVLHEFFELEARGWMHGKCEEVIAAAQEKRGKAQGSANKRWEKERAKAASMASHSERIADAVQTQSEGNAPSPSPSPTSQLSEEAKASLPGSAGLDCPHQEILRLYAKRLPQCGQHRTWDGARQASLRSRWHQAAAKSAYSEGYDSMEAGLRWWDGFFVYVGGTKLGDGFESEGRCWRPDLEWITKKANFQKIVDGKYDK